MLNFRLFANRKGPRRSKSPEALNLLSGPAGVESATPVVKGYSSNTGFELNF